MIKSCVVCGGEFDASGVGGFRKKTCSEKCSKENQRRWYHQNKDRVRCRVKQYYADNKERIREESKKYRCCNRQRILARQREWERENAAEIKARRQKRLDSDSDYAEHFRRLRQERYKRYVAKHRDKKLAAGRERTLKRAAALKALKLLGVEP